MEGTPFFEKQATHYNATLLTRKSRKDKAKLRIAPQRGEMRLPDWRKRFCIGESVSGGACPVLITTLGKFFTHLALNGKIPYNAITI